jgi:hypothetical protein
METAMTKPFKPADPTVEGFIVGLSGWKAPVVKKVRDIIREAAPDAVESIKRRAPHFAVNKTLCFFKIHMSHINLVFRRGEDLDDPHGLLLSYGKAKMRHLKLASLDDIDEAAIADLVRQAAKLNRASKSKPAR